MDLHRNSQKRIYIPGGIYFCTTATLGRYRYFEYPLLRNVLSAEIQRCQHCRGFDLYGYAIMPDHLHIMFRPAEGDNYPDIMHFMKRHSSRNLNIVLGDKNSSVFESGVPDFEGEVGQPRLQNRDPHPQLREWDAYIMGCRDAYNKNHGPNHNSIPFKWQKSYHDHYIRDEIDFYNHLKYIEGQREHHCMEGTVYVEKTQLHERYVAVTVEKGEVRIREGTGISDAVIRG